MYRNPKEQADSDVFLSFLKNTENLHETIKNLTPYAMFSSMIIDLIFTDLPNLVLDSGVHEAYNTEHK